MQQQLEPKLDRLSIPTQLNFASLTELVSYTDNLLLRVAAAGLNKLFTYH